MYLHLGYDVGVPFKEIVTIIDLESTVQKVNNKESWVEKNSVMISHNEPKSMIVVNHEKKNTLYFSPISSSTLQKRLNIWIRNFYGVT